LCLGVTLNSSKGLPRKATSCKSESMAAGVARCLLLLAIVVAVASGSSAQRFPRPVGYVNDFAGIISPQAEQLIESIALQVKGKTGAEIAVATIESTGGIDIEQYAVDLFMNWGIGERGKDNGVLILVAFKDRKLWIKPGYGVEGAVPDARAFQIYRDILRPGFRAGRYDEALTRAVTKIANLILAEAGEQLSLSDSTVFKQMVERRSRGGRQRLPAVFILLFFFPFLFIVIIRLLAMRSGYVGRHGGGFWIGGIGGSSGGFGGGFGGFGGGSCGGGGAGGGW